MRIPELRDYVVNLYGKENDRKAEDGKRTSLMVTGPPGIGKSRVFWEAGKAIAKQTRREFIEYKENVFFEPWSDKLTPKGQDVIDHPEKYFLYHVEPLNLAEPTDLTGKPKDVPEMAIQRYLQHFWIKLCSHCAGFLVLEDFLDTQRDDTMSAGYRVALDRVLGYIDIHPDMMVIATANTPDCSSLSRPMPLPLANRWELHEVEPPTVDEWQDWMNATYKDAWDKAAYVFLKRFENEGYILKLPPEPETQKAFPTHRSWTDEARKSFRGIFYPEALVGPDVGGKFRAFKAVNVDIEELIAKPELWKDMGEGGAKKKGKERAEPLDQKFMAILMLSTWLNKQPKENHPKSFGLIDAMTEESREFFVLLFRTTKSSALTRLFNLLFEHDKKYKKLAEETLSDRNEVSLEVRN